MSIHPGHPTDEIWSAPESGTERDETSGNQPSDRGINPGQKSEAKEVPSKDDPAYASEEA
jgi:hypothetical protein